MLNRNSSQYNTTLTILQKQNLTNGNWMEIQVLVWRKDTKCDRIKSFDGISTIPLT